MNKTKIMLITGAAVIAIIGAVVGKNTLHKEEPEYIEIEINEESKEEEEA